MNRSPDTSLRPTFAEGFGRAQQGSASTQQGPALHIVRCHPMSLVARRSTTWIRLRRGHTTVRAAGTLTAESGDHSPRMARMVADRDRLFRAHRNSENSLASGPTRWEIGASKRRNSNRLSAGRLFPCSPAFPLFTLEKAPGKHPSAAQNRRGFQAARCRSAN